jgi:uncharacterized protein YndB with AHSA1/START domain
MSNGPDLAFESTYHDIIDNERIVFSSTLLADDQIVTVSLTTVELTPHHGETRLLLTQQNAFLDGHEQPDWRERPRLGASTVPTSTPLSGRSQ